MKIERSDVSDMSRVTAKVIAERVPDPNGWNLAVRGIADRLRLDVTRIAFGSVLRDTCYAVTEEAYKQGRTVDQFWQAVNA
jgi:hypothetical protein